MKRCAVSSLIFFLTILSVRAGTSFENPQIHLNGDILFTLSHNQTGETAYSSLVLANAARGSVPRLLTCFPEKMEMLQNGSELQIRNRFGVVRYSFATKKSSSALLGGTLPQNPVRLGDSAVSPDGKWQCLIKKTSAAHGTLVLRNTSESAGQVDIVLAENIDFSFNRVPVKWSPDGAVIIYERANTIFFLRITDVERKTIVDEQYRTIGSGRISSVCWASEKNLVYIYKDVIYSIPAHELYTRAIYGSFVGIGGVLGRLTWNFDAATDSFWVNNSAGVLILLQGRRTIFSITLNEKPAEAGFVPVLSGFTVGIVPETAIGAEVFWDSTGKPLIWFESAYSKQGALYKINGQVFLKLFDGDSVWQPCISPDAKHIAFISNGDIIVLNIEWGTIAARLQNDTAVSLVWKNNDELIAGGMSVIRLWTINTDTTEILQFSSAGEYGRDEVSGKICMKTAFGTFIFDSDFRWTLAGRDVIIASPELTNGFYRVFTGDTPNKNFTNALYVRTLTGNMETHALFADTVNKSVSRGKVALVFDALDDASGVQEILRVLASYNLRATFFINGEFIRRYPTQLSTILDAGHSCASMFFTTADLTANGWVIDSEFIKRGLARNEDEFFAATGRELSLLWHTPGYAVNEMIKRAGQDAGYIWVNKGFAPPDRVTHEESIAQKAKYYSAADMIEIMSSALKAAGNTNSHAPDGFVIPVSVGIAEGTRNDYLYEKLDVLISAILDAEYDIVPVGEI